MADKAKAETEHFTAESLARKDSQANWSTGMDVVFPSWCEV